MRHKRIWIATLILIVGAIILIYPKLVIFNAIRNFQKIDSIHIEGSFKLGNDSYELDLFGNANYSNNILYSNLSTNYAWNPIKAEIYIALKENAIGLYFKTNIRNEWLFSEKSIDKKSSTNNFLSDIKFKKIKSDRKGEKKYKATLSKDIFLNLLSRYFSEADYSNDYIDIYLYIKAGNVSGLKIDDKIVLSEDLYLSNIDLKFSSWNRISQITISPEIEENSQEIDLIF